MVLARSVHSTRQIKRSANPARCMEAPGSSPGWQGKETDKQYPCASQAEKRPQAARNMLAGFRTPTNFRQRRGWAGCGARSGKVACGSLFLQTARLRASSTGSSRLFERRTLQAFIASFRDASARTDSRRFSWRVATTALPRDIARPLAALREVIASEGGSRIKSGMTVKQYPRAFPAIFGPQAAPNMLASFSNPYPSSSGYFRKIPSSLNGIRRSLAR